MFKQFTSRNFALLYRMILVGLFACVLSGSKSIAQNANFTANVRSGCAPLAVQFQDLSTGSITNYSWNLGNGNTSIFPNAFAIYTNPGLYTVTLTVQDTINGTSSTRTEVGFIEVYADPTPDFTADVTSGCAPLSVNFTDQSVAGDTSIVSWIWDFGDGTTSTDQNPSHTFTASGNFDITLITEDAHGCRSTYNAVDFISTSSINSVDFTVDQPYACNAPHNAQFTANINPVGPGYSYLWDFGDGATASGANPAHTYTVNGSYDVTLTVTDPNGCTTTESKTTYIVIDNPTADFFPASFTACVGQNLQFFNTSIGADGYTWTFGDGNTSNVMEPSHAYAAPGTYTVSLRATNTTFGCFDQEIRTSYITINPRPSVNFSSSNNIGCQSPMQVNFVDNSVGATSWLWDFGNGNTSTAADSADHVYTLPGNYTVSLTVTNAQGCTATETKPSYVRITPPQANFIAGPQLSGCLPLTVNFTDLSVANEPIADYFWNFGDGNIGSGAFPTHTYTTEGRFNVTLVIETISGCRDTLVMQDYIEAGNEPTVDFMVNPLAACAGDTIAFTDQTNFGTDWIWVFGDGGVSTAPNPTYSYTDTGVFDVLLIVENYGCYDSLIRDSLVRINGAVADFTMTPDGACEVPATITFLESSTSANTWNWDFGDGNTSTAQNTTHTYNSPGVYDVVLTVTDSITGCLDQERQTISITNPQANFSANLLYTCVGSSVSFTNSSIDANTYTWDFGDGNTSTDENPTHTFNIAGTYDIRLIASDGTCSDTLIRAAFIQIAGPNADFAADLTTGCAPLGVSFSDSSTVPSGSPIVNWLWDFGDGNTSIAASPIHTYADTGLYSVTLTVLDADGCLASVTRNNYINPTRPVAAFTSNDTIACPGTFVEFTSLSTGNGITHSWDFGDGTSSNAINPIHVFPANGTYSIILTVTDANGCTDVEGKLNYVTVGDPVAQFTADSTSADCPPLNVNFVDQSSANVVNYYWDFGDGSTSNLANPSKVYSRAGTYDVTLIVETLEGCQDTLFMPNYIQITGPSGSFDFIPKEGCNPLNVTFVGTGTNVSQYTWDFGDGSGSIGQVVTHTYTSDTIARPVLLIRDVNGCQVAVTSDDSVNVRALADPSFTINYSAICLGQVATFTNTTTSERPIIAYDWDFGDGTSSTDANPNHTYTVADTFFASLTVTTLDGCVDSITSPVVITVTEPPTAFFTADPQQACEPSTVILRDSSSGVFTLVDWHWDFGDGDTANGEVIGPHTYTSPGIYTTTLTVTDDEGCEGSVNRIIEVYENPTVDFSADRFGCAPRTVNFSDLSSSVVPIVSWSWDFGDGVGTSNVRNPSYTYNTDGIYTVLLTVVDANGCTHTLTKNDYIILRHPQADFISSANITCPPQDVQFVDRSIPDTTLLSWFWDFGDGNTSTDQNPTHTYHASDSFDVTLIVSNILGCRDTIVQPNHVITFERPTASISLSDTAACVPETITMSSTSTAGDAPLQSYRWDVGTGVNLFGPTTSYLYTSDGSYTLSLIVTDQNGCRDTAEQLLNIYSNPVANFVADDSIGCSIVNIPFTDLSTGTAPINSWAWDFGDGGVGSTRNPTYTYLNDGLYDVSLTVTDINGCQGTLLKNDYIHLDHPEANFTLSSTDACPGATLNFTDISTGISVINSWFWDFGDGNTSMLQNPSHAYLLPGTYSVTLTVTDVKGCQHSITQPNVINIYNNPAADFGISNILDCTPMTSTFTDSTIAGDAAVVAWSWDFGDGGTTPVQNPTYVYNNPGTYNVSLIATDANGCTSIRQKSVQSLSIPSVDFIADQRVGCSPIPVEFTDQTFSAYTLTTWEWDFGDGNTSGLADPVHNYAADGSYEVSLKVTDLNGCSDSVSRPAYVRLSHPVASFSISRSLVCPGDPIGVTFTDTSTPDTTLQSWLWDFGDGSTSTDQNPNHAYLSPGTYTVSFTVTNVLNCSDTHTEVNIVEVRNAPTAAFTPSVTQGCAPLFVSFTDNSVQGDGAIIDWNWDFGTGAQSLVRNPSYTFTTSGTYTVSLTTRDANGCINIITQDIEVFGLPVSDFISSQRVGCAPEVITFTDQSSGPSLITNWAWDFGDGFVDSVANPTHTYSADGSYAVSLKVSDINGCTDSLYWPDFIRLSHPVANFTQDINQVCPGIPIGVSFTDASVPDTTLASWNWDFGDGNTSTLQNPSHSYNTPGDYTVILEVTNILGCTDSDTIINPIEVLTPPTTAFGLSNAADCASLTVAFSDSSTAGDAGIVAWNWDFGNGDVANVQNPVYTYNTAGVYTVTLTTTDANGCQSATTEAIQAYEVPQPEFVASQTVGCATASISFTDLSTSAVNITSWSWDFGDGGTASVKNPLHVYTADGVYTVSLTVVDANGCTQTITKPNYIRLSHPVAGFSMDRFQVCPGDSIVFTDESIPDTTLQSWAWNFGDGNTSTLQNPSHIYTAPGVYAISLTVSNVLNCSDVITLTDTVEVVTPVTPDFVANPESDCIPLKVQLTDSSQAGSQPILTWSWDFGDGNTSIAQNPNHEYTTPGTYTISLTVTDANGCSVDTSKDVVAHPLPTAEFIANQRVGCSPVPITFTDLSTGTNNITNWNWDFGDGGNAVAKDPTHNYNADGTYTVSLEVIDVNGCRDTVTKVNYIRLSHPDADFSWDISEGCPGMTVNFQDQTIPDTTINTYLWDFGDGNTSNLANPSHIYDTPGVYTVSLQVRNVLGCTDSETRSNIITVLTPPIAQFTPSTLQGCTPLTVSFADNSIGNSSGIASRQWDFGNGNTSTSFSPPAQTYTTPGIYSVILEVADANGCIGIDTQYIEVLDLPTADFVANQTVSCSPVNISFTDISTGSRNITAWQWDFGDGQVSTAQNPVNTYSTDGTYSVSLTIFDQTGCSASITKNNYIRLRHPVPDFTMTGTQGCTGLAVDFTDQTVSDTTIQVWQWDFGDGTTSTAQNPSHIYTNSGVYTVELTVIDAVNCIANIAKTDTIEIFTSPTTQFSISNTLGCAPFDIQVTDLSLGNSAPLVSRMWDFGDGTSDTSSTVNHIYTNPGIYTITLTTTDANACYSTYSRDVEVKALPTASFFSNVRAGCAPIDIPFIDLSSGPATITNWYWDFGDGGNSNLKDPTYTYASGGMYDIELIVEDIFGCRDTLARTEYIKLSRPVADFAVDQTQTCPGTNVNFTDTSIPDTTIVGWLWDFGDGTTDTAQNPTHFYDTPGTYTVSLTVTNILGCDSSIVRNNLIEIATPPTVQFSPDRPADCIPFSVSLNDSSIENTSPIANYSWDLGDGNFDLVQNPNHTYTVPGSYTVTLILTDTMGCVSRDSMILEAYSLPSAEFEADTRLGCATVDISFSDSTTGDYPLSSWNWDFGDGGTSTSQNPTYTYNSDGLFSVGLIVEDINGCRDSITKADYINLRRPVADFSINADEVCPGTEIQFTDLSVPDTTLMAWLWDFGDGTNSTAQNPTHAYITPGTYTVSLTVTNILSCSATETKVDTITILPRPTAQFTVPATDGCYPFEVDFSNTTTIGSSPIAGYQWDFGNGATSTLPDPSYTFSQSGIYTVSLIAIDQNSCTDTITMDINALDHPVAAFGASDSVGCSAKTITFISQASGTRPVVSWEWDFGDGNNSTSQFPTHTYTSDGNFDVSLIVTDATGCVDTLEKVSYINLTRPQIDFAASPTQACPGSSINFTDLTIPDTTLTSWLWDFGDGNTSTDQNPSHIYDNPGSYTVSLTVRNARNCEVTEVKTDFIEIYNPPTAAFTPGTLEGCIPLEITFTNSSTANSGIITGYEWDFDNGNTSTQLNALQTYSQPGVYQPQLIVSDQFGCRDTVLQTITVHGLPTVGFTVSDSLGCAPQNIRFIDTSSGPAAIVGWNWDFGDGNSANVQFPNHTYTNDGVYDISLIATDQFGCSDTLTKDRYIRLSHPDADFSMNITEICRGGIISFTDQSIPDTTLNSWMWDFGDGTTSTDRNPSHTYTSPGTYNVSLTVGNVLSCSDTETKNAVITVRPGPSAQFIPSDSANCSPLSVNFTNTSTGNSGVIVAYQWDFGNGVNSIVPNPGQVYTDPGTYPVKLIATDNLGCQDSITKDIIAFERPSTDFEVSDSLGCAPVTLFFQDLTSGSYPVSAWNWDFGDGNTANTPFPNHTYANDGTFDVSLISTDINGCSDTLTKVAYIELSHPVANFSESQIQECEGNRVSFSDLSVPDTTLISWAWDFGDGNSSNQQNPTHFYTASGTYNVELTVTNILGCSHTIILPVIVDVLVAPAADFAPSAIQGCVPLTVDFVNQTIVNSAPVGSYLWSFDDGQTTTVPDPSHTFTQAGTYTVRLIATDTYGCRDTFEQDIEVLTLPEADFTVSDSLGCSPAGITFFSQSTGTYAISSYLWDFGNGNTSNNPIPTHTYQNDGVYDVSLVVSDVNGCLDSISKARYIRLDHPVASFRFNKDRSCPGTELSFIDESIPDTTLSQWFWNFGDGNTSTEQNPNHIYTVPGIYSVTLTVTNILGCSDDLTLTDTIEVFQSPDPAFTPSTLQGCVPLDISLSESSTGNSGTVVAWNWDFGNGTASTIRQPQITYDEPGTYVITLYVTDSNGCIDSTKRTINVWSLPEVAFGASDSLGCAPTNIRFTDQTVTASTLTNWQWDFGDGGTSNAQNPIYDYTQDGVYDVSLIVTDLNGCRDTLEKERFIRLSHPDAAFTTDQTEACPGTSIQFTDTSIPDTSLISWEWDFGDGSSSIDQNPEHLYTNAGDYTVTLTVRNILGCEDTEVRTDVVRILPPPDVSFQPSVQAGCVPLDVSFTNTTQITSAPVSSWQWDFGNGDSAIFTNSTYTFTQPGEYTVRLSAIDANGCTSYYEELITVYSLPQAAFTATDSISCAPFDVEFLDQSSGDQVLSQWTWDFGDGQISNSPFPSHTYQSDGVYDVSLIIADEFGCRDTLVKPRYIRLSHPVADFSVDKTSDCPGSTWQFAALTIPDTTLVGWQWDFGDGNSSNQQSPEHVYTDPGLYTVRLIITNVLGCSDTMTKSQFIRVWQSPEAIFMPEDSVACSPASINFIDMSQGTDAPVVSWSWDMGNGQTTMAQNPQSVYNNPGIYDISLTITDNHGCQDSTQRNVELFGQPTASFQSLDTIGCAPLIANFVDLSTGRFPITAWEWDFGDGNTSTEQNPAHQYIEDGLFDITLVAIDSYGCRDTATRVDYVRLRNPQADFSVDQRRGCPGITVTFSDNSIPDTTLASWQWDFGDGSVSVQQNPIHTYEIAGTYDVSLIITNVIGCTDTILYPAFIQIYEAPQISFVASDTSYCGPFIAEFIDFSSVPQGAVSWEWSVDDSTIAFSQNTSHYFGEAGEYIVDLTITDNQGCTGTNTMEITVYPEPVASFTVSDSMSCAPTPLTFQDLSEPRPASWRWDFGDGDVSTEQNPVHSYAEDGLYDVELIIEDRNGCQDTLLKPNFIRLDRPIANFTVDAEPGCAPLFATFEGSAQGPAPIDIWSWDFGDGKFAAGDSVRNPYTQAGVYRVTLLAVDSLGCQDTVYRDVSINIIPNLVPEAPRLHYVSVESDNSVKMEFAPFSGNNFEKYIIYRESKDTPGIYEKIGENLTVEDTTFLDTGVDALNNFYCYKITVQNNCGSESGIDQSAEHCTMEVTAVPVTDEIIVDWNPYRGCTVTQYEIYRVDNYSPYQVEFVDLVPGNTTIYRDPSTECFNAYDYRIRAVCSSDAWVSWSDTTRGVNQKSVPVEPSEMVRATVEDNKNVLIEWKPFGLEGERVVYVERQINGGQWFTKFTLPSGEEKVLDQDVDVFRNTYAYRVSAQDSCGYRTDPSNVAKTILVEAESEQGLNKIKWSAYEEWEFGVERYEIEVYNDTLGQYVLLDAVPSTTFSYDDYVTNFDQPEICYRVWAVELGGNDARSLSNEICLPVEGRLDAPNAFTPNFDGVNDEFKINGLNVRTFHMRIFSRWGLKVFETYDIEEGWDGTYNGAPMQEGVYVYIIEGQAYDGFPFEYKGNVTLLR